MSLIYYSWPMALYWFSVSHRMPRKEEEKRPTHVSSPPRGALYWHNPHSMQWMWMHVPGRVFCTSLVGNDCASHFLLGKVIDIYFIGLWEQALLFCCVLVREDVNSKINNAYIFYYITQTISRDTEMWQSLPFAHTHTHTQFAGMHNTSFLSHTENVLKHHSVRSICSHKMLIHI